MPDALTSEQLREASAALGFEFGEELHAAAQPGSPREVTLMLAALEALVVRWQLDQDIRDPLAPGTQYTASLYAQGELNPAPMDTLAAALRRVQTATGLVAGQADDPRFPGRAVVNLIAGCGLLLAAWIAGHADDTRAREDGEAPTQEDMQGSLSKEAARHVAWGAEQLRVWRKSRALTI
jgi:hypothetical protein